MWSNLFYLKIDHKFQNIKSDMNANFSELIAILIDLNFYCHLVLIVTYWLNVGEKKSDWADKLVLFSLLQKWQVTCYIFLGRTIMLCDFPTVGRLQQLLEIINILPPTLMDTQSKLYLQRWQEKRSSLVTTQNRFL